MVVGPLVQMVHDDARRFCLPRWTAWLLFWLPPVATLLFALTVLHRPLFVFLTREDSLLEWAQVVCFLLASVMAGTAAARFWRCDGLAALLIAGFAVIAFVAAGEEVSWGQRVFGWSTPEALGSINHQNETTVHNIMPVQKTLNYVQLFAGFYGGVVAAVLRRRWRGRPLWVDVLLPATFLAPAFLVLANYRLVRLTVLTEERFVFVKFGEMPELCFAFAVATMAVLFLRLTAVRGAHVGAHEAADDISTDLLEGAGEAHAAGRSFPQPRAGRHEKRSRTHAVE